MRKIFVYFFMVYWLFSSSLVVKKTILVDMEWMLVTPVTLGQPTGWVFWYGIIYLHQLRNCHFLQGI